MITTLPIARSVFGADAGGATRVDLEIADGIDSSAVIHALETRLQSEPFVVSTPREIAASLAATTGDFAAMTALIAAVALFAGAFLIFNTLSMTVVERVRELGLLRAAGATRRQLTGYILLRLGRRRRSALGILLGGVLASGVSGWIGSVGAVPVGTPVARLEDALAAFAVGVGVTMAAAVEPSRRAGRVAPVEALKARLELPSTRRARLRWLVVVFAVVGVLGLAIWPRAAGEAAIVRALVVYVVLLVAALLVPVTLPTLARVAGTPFIAIARLEERLGRASVLRDRSRAALTVGALTIGLSLIVALVASASTLARPAAGSPTSCRATWS